MTTFAFSSAARASPNFPKIVADELALDTAPQCTLCHTSPARGFGTAQQPLAIYLRSRGLRASDTNSLLRAFEAAEGEQSDVDDDGSTDVEELMLGDDPNSARSAVQAPSYGCALVPPGADASPAPFGLLLMLALSVRRRRDRRQPQLEGDE